MPEKRILMADGKEFGQMFKKNKVLTVLLGMMVVVTLASCSSHLSMMNQFDESVNRYNKLLSSQSFDAAGIFSSETLSKEFSERIKAAKNIKVVDHRIVRIKYDQGKETAEVEVEIQYYTLSSYQLKTLIDVQKWAYVTENGVKQWRLMSLLPEFP